MSKDKAAPGSDFGHRIRRKAVATDGMGKASDIGATHFAFFKNDTENVKTTTKVSAKKYNANAPVTGNGIVSYEIEAPVVDSTKESNGGSLHTAASEVGVSAHLVLKPVVEEPFDHDALSCSVALTVCRS